MTPENRDGRAESGPLAEAIRQATDRSVELAWADQDYIGAKVVKAAEELDIIPEIVRHPQARHGFVLLPRRTGCGKIFGMGNTMQEAREGL
ncbi:hypothetical protein AOE01nite_12890 [Acetobacter oeni]|uniref:Transposase IS4-like domain-containing protein n=1 Tax=Acetobacter oeni TaxID=304077 RepID=A0A511XJE6_9PROT|nr:hypothetical protein [Acetobacter oeni]GEN63065.1 hypothetical protein AOE01nite_12890 [Acetobacter oeni]